MKKTTKLPAAPRQKRSKKTTEQLNINRLPATEQKLDTGLQAATNYKFMKAIGVLKWNGLSVSHEISSANTTVTAMTKNVYFTTPNPALEDVLKAINELDTAQQVMKGNGGGTKLTIARNAKRKVLQGLMAQLVTYVNNIADGDADVVASAALAVKRAPVRRGRLEATAHLYATALQECMVYLNWKTLPGAVTWHVQMSADVLPLAWQEFAGNLVTETKLEVSNLTSGSKLWFRVMAVNAAGEGLPSNPVVVRVP